MVKVFTGKARGEAVKNGESTIEIEGTLVDTAIKARKKSKVSWVSALGVAAYALIIALPTAGVDSFISSPIAVIMLGCITTYTVLAIAAISPDVSELTNSETTKNSLDNPRS